MSHEYTRQRQGRDFPLHNYLQNAETSVEGDYNNIDGIINGAPKDDEAKKTLLDRLERYKEEAAHQCDTNTVPVDGHEPSERGR